ncbi:hypothetical protein Tco_0657281 [Tanacetum coccineum]|uniref:Transmembrane protein n=1 Tax=Tanacetum coccineum TaxID=301880 RepID=A0ABQ4XBR1_9ASTR
MGCLLCFHALLCMLWLPFVLPCCCLPVVVCLLACSFRILPAARVCLCLPARFDLPALRAYACLVLLVLCVVCLYDPYGVMLRLSLGRVFSERRERASRSGARENESEKTIEHNDKKEQKTEQRESNERKRSRRRARQLETKERGKRETGASQRENESRHDKRDKPRRNAGATSAGRERDGSRERAERKHEQRR